jgi:prophage maintenance system killer protein
MIKFLSKETIVAFHKDQIETYGGSQGIRDRSLFERGLSALKRLCPLQYHIYVLLTQ